MKKVLSIIGGIFVLILVFTFYPVAAEESIINNYLATGTTQKYYVGGGSETQGVDYYKKASSRVEVVFPLIDSQDRKIYATDDFWVWRDYKGATGYHNGVDIGVFGIGNLIDTGIKVVSATPGFVKSSNYHDSMGYYVIIIDPRTGLQYVYMHLKEQSSLKKDDRVEAGDLIGTMGNTGYSKGNHLHFEVRVPGFTSSEDATEKGLYQNGRLHPFRNKYTVMNRESLPKLGFYQTKFGDELYEMPIQ